jgi:membrane-bound ClpP family serine protease
MSIGTGIALFVIGAILTFAINVDLGGAINLDLIGYILMGAGFIIFVIGLVLTLRKRQSITTVSSGVGANGEAVQQRSTSSNDSPIVPPTA